MELLGLKRVCRKSLAVTGNWEVSQLACIVLISIFGKLKRYETIRTPAMACPAAFFNSIFAMVSNWCSVSTLDMANSS